MVLLFGLNLRVEHQVLVSLFEHDLFGKPVPTFPDHALEREQHVHHLAAVSRLLHVGQLAVAAIGDAGLRDLA
jgi:hypothetical protein